MPAATEHRIRRARFDVELASGDEAIGAPAKLEEIFVQRIMPALSDSLDRQNGSGIVAIDRLEIDLGTIDLRTIDHEGAGLEAIIEAAVRGAVADGRESGDMDARHRARDDSGAPPATETRPSDGNVLHSLLRFLETGLLEWDGPASLVELEEALIELSADEQARVLAAIGKAAASRPQIVERLGLQLGVEARRRLARSAEPIRDRLPAALLAVLDGPRSRTGMRKPHDDAAKEPARDGQPSGHRRDDEREADGRLDGPETVRDQHADEILPESALTDAEPDDSDTEASDLDETTLHVTGAGVVLLHPFLPTLFETVGLTESDGTFADEASHEGDAAFADEASRERAVHLLSFLVSGAENGEEPAMALFKVLCDWPLERPIRRELALSAREQNECAQLLRSCVSHWSRLRNTSIHALQTEFLQRDGLLRREDDDWRLIVEQRSIDVLLDSIPWSVSRIRLPWMQSTMLVDWR